MTGVDPHAVAEHTPDPLMARIAATMARRGGLAAAEPVLALVSGGADSTLLMHALAELHGGPVTVLTVDHGLRPAAAAECVAHCAVSNASRWAASVGLPPRPTPARLATRLMK